MEYIIDHKLTEKIKQTEKRNKLMRKQNKNTTEKIKSIELQKLIKKEIKTDVQNYDNKIIEIIEDDWITKRTTKELSKGQNLIPNLQNQRTKEGIIKKATELTHDETS